MPKLYLISLLLFVGFRAYAQNGLPFRPEQVVIDNETDSLYHYSGASKQYVVAARPPRDPNATRGKLIVDTRGIGKPYSLWTNDEAHPAEDFLGIQDKQGRIYWLDNKAHTLSMYQDGKLIWQQNVLLATFCGGSGVVHHVQLRQQRIYVWDGCAWGGYNRSTGKMEDGGND